MGHSGKVSKVDLQKGKMFKRVTDAEISPCRFLLKSKKSVSFVGMEETGEGEIKLFGVKKQLVASARHQLFTLLGFRS